MTKGPSTPFESETFGQDVSFKLEQPVGSMSISPCGRDVVLASREGLHIIDLDSPWDPPRYLAHHTSWEVADVQWSPFGARDNWVASTSNQKALVWNLDAPASDAVEFVLHGHTRAITDINFSAHDPNVLATCAVDSFVHIWDLSSPQRPAISFSDWFAGATQVKWSRQDPNVIASSHDKYLRIWDKRKGAYPVRSIEAHGTKIYGVDWNRFHSNKIVTCSLDKTVKFWDINDLEDVPERTIETPFPVWRARHTPFGWGLLAMPQRSNGDLYLYDRRPNEGEELPSGAVPPAKIFQGHEGQVKEFLWRARGNIESGIDHREFQLVSWGTDRQLRLHLIDPETNLRVGYEKGSSKTQRLNFTRRGAKYRTFRDEPSDASSPISNGSKLDSPSTTNASFRLRPRTNTSIGMNKTLPRFRGWVHGGGARAVGMYGRSTAQHQMNPISWMKNVKIKSAWDQETLADEITQVGEQLPKVQFEFVDVHARKVTVSMNGLWGEENAPLYLRLEIKFAKSYPAEGTVSISLQKTNSMTQALYDSLNAEMKAIAEAYASRRKGCLEAILRYLLRDQTKDTLVSRILEEAIMDSKILQEIDLGDNSSSSDEDERLDHSNGVPGLRNPPDVLNANALVPVAKGCGALWSDCGKLVCFFPTKPKEPASFFDHLDPKEQEHLRSSNYGGFARLGSDLLSSKLMGEHGDDDDDSDDSEGSSTSSGSSSSPVDLLSSMPGFPKKAWHLTVSGLQRSRSADRSNHSTNDLRLGGSAITKLLNFVSIRTFDDLMPSKRELALEYKVFGNGPEVCGHNAEVASRAGLDEIASVWRLARLILKDGLSLECHRDLKSGENIITIAKKVSSRLKKKDSGIDLSYDSESQPLATSGRVRWGNSPFGPGYLIGKVMSHFEDKGDVQMLAMLSCVFAEPKAGQVEDIETLLRPHRRQELSMQIKAPAFSVDYHPSVAIARSILDSTFTSFKASYAPSVRTGYDKSNGVSPNPLSEGSPEGESSSAAPSVRETSTHAQDVLRNLTAGYEGVGTGPPSPRSTSISLSTSPEDSRLSRRSDSSLPFSFSRSSLTALAKSYSNSPPANSVGTGIASSIKRYSPSGSLTPGWNTVGMFAGSGSGKGPRSSQQSSGPSSEETRAARSYASTSYSGSRQKRGSDIQEHSRNSVTSLSRASTGTLVPRPGKPVPRQIKFKVSLHNQKQFDNDGYAAVPLLCPKLEWKFKAYRATYAHLLGVWELYPQMAEVLKFDGLRSYFADAKVDEEDAEEESALRIGNARRRRTFIEASKVNALEKRGLELRRNCNECGKALTAVEKNGVPFAWHCVMSQCASSSQKKSTRVFCTICNNAITGLMVPCLSCGHVTCHVCALAWFGTALAAPHKDNETSPELDDGGYCPSGCGCQCSEHEFVAALWPEGAELEVPAMETLTRQRSYQTTRSERSMSQHALDPASAALLSLTRTRSISTTKSSTTIAGSLEKSSAIDDRSEPSDDELDPWARNKNSRLDWNVGGELSRGLSTKSSDATIRKSNSRG
jgi:WD40 repeat protein